MSATEIPSVVGDLTDAAYDKGFDAGIAYSAMCLTITASKAPERGAPDAARPLRIAADELRNEIGQGVGAMWRAAYPEENTDPAAGTGDGQ